MSLASPSQNSKFSLPIKVNSSRIFQNFYEVTTVDFFFVVFSFKGGREKETTYSCLVKRSECFINRVLSHITSWVSSCWLINLDFKTGRKKEDN